MGTESETVEGYVIDIACVRKNAREDLYTNAETHTKDCALAGHCVESGYAVVTSDDRLVLLDASTTPDIVEIIKESERERGHHVRARRDFENGEITTTTVEEVAPE